MSTYSGNSSSLSVPLHHVPSINSTSLHVPSLMRPSYLYTQHSHHYQQQQQQQRQPAHQLTRPSPASNSHMNAATQRIGLEAFGNRPGSTGAPPGLIDLSCSGPRLQHHYQIEPSASDVSGKVYALAERDARTQSLAGSGAGHITDLKLMIPSTPSDTLQQVKDTRTVVATVSRVCNEFLLYSSNSSPDSDSDSDLFAS